MIRARLTGVGRPMGNAVENEIRVAGHDTTVIWDMVTRRYASTVVLILNITLFILILRWLSA